MERKWWHGKTAYQIYPKSFCDSNGDGIGDLQGIISKLDYLKDLGIDLLWISPVYCSPMADQGYDISDYYNIDPMFGTMADMDELLAESKKRGIGIVMDLVVNHCSDEHEWFKKACEDPDGKYGKYFYIENWHEGERLPCNWRGCFGDKVWEKLPGHDDKIYMHTFHKRQPDLNWENPEVREEIYKMINWWLDKGLAGFRIDAITNIKKKLPFKDYPADRPDGTCNTSPMIAEAEGLLERLNELADHTFRKYDAFTVGEVTDVDPKTLPDYIGDNGCFSTIFDFSPIQVNMCEEGWYAEPLPTAEEYKSSVFSSQKRMAGVGYLANIIENHDEPRAASHFIAQEDCSETSKKMLAGLYFMLQGIPFIYQGQELGMENIGCTDISETDDIFALGEYQAALDAGLSVQQATAVVSHFSRDNARTPVQWNDQKNAGFTTGTPWMPVNPNYHRINLAEQMGREDSLWNFYRKLTTLRRNPDYRETIVYGATIPYLEEEKNLMAYFRRGEQNLLVMGNFQKEARKVVLPGRVKKVLLNNLSTFQEDNGSVAMEGYQLLILEL